MCDADECMKDASYIVTGEFDDEEQTVGLCKKHAAPHLDDPNYTVLKIWEM